MPRKCSVYGCRTNYATGSRGKVFSFPKNPEERDRWIRCLPNKNFKWSQSKGVCAVHWPAGHPTRKAKSGELIPAGPPSVFPGVPRLLVPTPPPKPRKLNRLAIRSAQPDEVATFNDQDSFDESNYGDKLAAVSKDARVFSTDSEWRILADERSGSVPSFSVFISKQTQLAECYSKFVKVAVPFVSGKKVNKVSQVEAIVDYLRKYVHGGSQVSFIERQIELTGCHRFNPTDLENAFALRSKSSACYDAFREFLVLPDRRILQRWKKPVSDIENVPSVEEMLDVHEPQQRQCVLLSDEDNVKPMIV